MRDLSIINSPFIMKSIRLDITLSMHLDLELPHQTYGSFKE